MDPQDPTSTLFSLDDATERIEQESLDEGISAMMDVLNQAKGILRDVIIPNGRVSALSFVSLFFSSSCIFVFLTLVFLSVPHCS